MPDAPDTPPLSPSAFVELVSARVERLHDAASVLLRGVPVKTSSTSREYGGFVHAQAHDPGYG